MDTRNSEVCDVRYVDADRVRGVLQSLAAPELAEAAANVFRVLADPRRIAIVHALSLAELCNCDVASIVGLSESAVSHLMRELRLLKVVASERRGRMVYYRLSDGHIREILEDTLRHVAESNGHRSIREGVLADTR